MHELLLFAQVPSARHEQILNIIAGIAGMPPKKIIERHVIFKPKRAPSFKSGPMGASQGVQNQQIQAIQGQLKGELFYLQLVNDVSETSMRGQDGSQYHSSPGDGSSERSDGRAKGDGNPTSWSLCFFDLPEVAGRRPVTSRMISSVEILEGDAMGFMDGLGYRYVELSVHDDRHVLIFLATHPSIYLKAIASYIITSYYCSIDYYDGRRRIRRI